MSTHHCNDENMANTIQNLPAELLREVFSHLGSANVIRGAGPGQLDWHGDGRNGWDGRSFHDGRLAAVKSARLTCRRFNEAASPFLLATIRVRVDQRSLDRVKAIVANRLVASGVRCVRVDLSVYPWAVAETLESFTSRQRHDIQRIDDNGGEKGARFPTDPECLVSEGTCMRHAHCRVWYIHSYIESILAACHVTSGAEARHASPDYPDNRATLIAAYDKFKAMHEEQEHLVASGDYVECLAACISAMPKFGALCLDVGDTKLLRDPQTTF